MTRIGRTMHSANNRDSRRRGMSLLLIAPMMALCAALSFAPDALADDGSAQDAATTLADAVQVDAPAGGAGADSLVADGAASDFAADTSAADAEAGAEAGSADGEAPAGPAEGSDPGQAADGGDAGIADASGPADGADGDAAPQQPPAADGDGTASAEAPAGADGTLSGQDDAPSIPATMDRPTVGTRDASSAAVSWAAVEGASAYEVRWSPDGISWTCAIADSACFDALGLDPDRRYLFQVRAIMGQGDSAVCGDWSASRAFTTPYLISYGLNGGVQAAGQRGWYRQNSATYILLAPTRNGYDFAGWYGDESLSGDAIDRILHGSAGNISLFAKWSQRDYTVTYILNGSEMFAAQNASRNPLTYVAGTGDITLASATRTGYHFAGWYLDEGLTRRIESIPADSATDLVLYAKWLEREYAIRYVINSEADSPAANSADNPGTYRTGQEIVLADPRKNYCFFQGWFLDEDCTLRLGRIPIGCTGNIVLYAKWHEGEGDTIDIDPDHQDVVEYASGTVQVDDAVYTIGDGFVSIDMGASADPDALSALIGSLRAGQVLVLMPTEAEPDGYCIRFDSLSIVDGNAIVSGSAPDYEEMIGDIDLEGTADSGSFTFTPADGVTVEASPSYKKALLAGMSPRLADEIQFIKLKLNFGVGGFSAEVTLSPGFEYKITNKGGNLYVYAVFTGTLEAKLGFKNKADEKIKLGHVSVPLNVPGMRIDYTVYLVSSIDASVSLKATQKYSFGFEYKDGKLGSIGKANAEVGDFEGITDEIALKAGVDGSLALKMFREALLDVSLGTGLKSSASVTLRGDSAKDSMVCVDVKTRVYAELSFGKYSMIGKTFKINGTFSFPWLDEKDPVCAHIEKKPGGSWVIVRKCTWGQEAEKKPLASGKCGKGVYWSLSERGTLKIWGKGDMGEYYPGHRNLIEPEKIGEYYPGEFYPEVAAPWKEYCGLVKKVIIGKGVTKISGFYDLPSLTSVTLPNSVTEIGRLAFDHCASLTSVTLPDSVTEIGYFAFDHCTSLSSVEIPNSVRKIWYGAFSDCTSLASVVIPDSVTSLGYGAFRRCTSLSSVSISDSLTVIWDYVFESCTSLTSITIPDSVIEIGSAFIGCTSLVTVKIPDSVIKIQGAFSDCTSLASIAIPDSVTEIGAFAFSGCTSLTSINIPDSVIDIGWFAFEGCISLTSLYIPDSVTWIDDYAFEGCSSLKHASIPSFDILGEGVFDDGVEVVARDGTSQVIGYTDSDLDAFCVSDELCFVVQSYSVGCAAGACVHEESSQSESVQVTSDATRDVESEELFSTSGSVEFQEQDFLEPCVANDDAVVLLVFSQESDPRLNADVSSSSEEPCIVVAVAIKDEDLPDASLSTDPYQPNSVLIA